MEMLQLSITSYNAGNENKYNTINSISDELLKLIKKMTTKNCL